MKRLMLLRHAKAEARNAERDFDRVLARRGRDDMVRIAAYLAAEALRPDQALVSPAARTRETWQRAGLPEVPVTFVERIYDASAAALLRVVRGADPGVSSVILVGHNPGIEELAAGLLASDPIPGMSTGALAVIDFDIESWDALAPRTGRLDRFVVPADLAAEAG